MTDTLDAITGRYLREGYFAGAVLRIERSGHPPFERAWGNAVDTASRRVPMTPGTLFDAASLTKLFTTTAILRLVTLGSLLLDTPVAGFLDLQPPLRTAMRGIDLTELLTHSSGLPWWYPFYTRRPEPFLRILADVVPARPPRGTVAYSDLNFMVLGLVVERAAGKPLPDAVDELVFRPLGLARTSYARPIGPAAATETGNRIEQRMVAEMGLSFDGWRDPASPILGEPDDGNCHYYFSGAAGHAGIFTGAADLCRLGRLYLDRGQVDGRQLLAPGLAERAAREQVPGRGLGFQAGASWPAESFGHTGFTGTCLAVLPRQGAVAALLTNRLHVPEPRDIAPWRAEILEAVAAATGETGAPASGTPGSGVS